MATYLSQKELVKQIGENLSKIEAGELNISEMEQHLDLVRELYERTLILNYKAMEIHSSVSVKKVQENQELEVEEEEVSAHIAENLNTDEPNIEMNEYAPIAETLTTIPENSFAEKNTTVVEEEAGFEFDLFGGPSTTIEEEVEEIQLHHEPTVSNEPSQPVFEEQVIAEKKLEEKAEEESNEWTIPSYNKPVEQQEEQLEIKPTNESTFPTMEATSNVSNQTGEFTALIYRIEKAIKNQLGFNSLPTLIGSFGLNERLLYINELFDGSSENFSNVIKKIDSLTTLDDAANYIEEIASSNNWEIDSETVEEFIQKLCRRFS